MTAFTTEITVVDERSITIPNGKLTTGDTEQIGRWIANNAQEGYNLKSVEALTSVRGHQRDPYTVTTGVKVVLEREVSS